MCVCVLVRVCVKQKCNGSCQSQKKKKRIKKRKTELKHIVKFERQRRRYINVVSGASGVFYQKELKNMKEHKRDGQKKKSEVYF